MGVKILPQDSVDLAERLLAMANDKIDKLTKSPEPRKEELEEIRKLVTQSIHLLNTTDNGE